MLRFLLLVLLSGLTQAAVAAEPASRLRPQPAWDQMLDRTDTRWAGADGGYSVRLSPTTVLWLFGDTVLGAHDDGRRTQPKLVNNSLGLQVGDDPATAAIRFYWGAPSSAVAPSSAQGPTASSADASSADAFAAAGGHGAEAGAPRAFFVPETPDTWYWPFDAALVGDRLAVFLMEIRRTPAGGVMGFRQVGSALAMIADPRRSPRRWRPEITPLPFTRFPAGGQRFWGASVMPEGEHLYVYGYDEVLTPAPPTKRLVVARAPLAAPEEYARWQFFDGEGFVSDPDAAVPVAPSVPAEFTVRPTETGGFAFTHSWGDIDERGIFRRTAPNPWGPWSPPERLGNCPEEGAIEDSACYSAKAHPHLKAPPGRQLITYCTNSSSFWKMLADEELYYPRFFEVDAP